MNLRPLKDTIIVSPIEQDDITPGGIALPDVAKEKPQRGTVLAVGPGKREGNLRYPPDIEEGDIVLFIRYTGSEVTVDGKIVLILKEDNILAVEK